jgi:hypothetical protein
VETYIASKEWLNRAIELYYKTALAIDADIDRVTRATVTDAQNSRRTRSSCWVTG